MSRMVRFEYVESPSQKFWRLVFTAVRGLLALIVLGAGLLAIIGVGSSYVTTMTWFEGTLGPLIAGTAAWAGVLCVVTVVTGLLGALIIRSGWRWVCLIAAGLMLLMAFIVPGGPYPKIPAPERVTTGFGSPMKVFEANLLYTNSDGGKGIAQEIHDADADFVILVETSPVTADALKPVLARYPYRFESSPTGVGDSTGIAIYSKYDLRDYRKIDLPVRPALTAVANVHGKQVRIVAVHPAAPVDIDWTAAWAHTFPILTNEIRDFQEDHLIVAGDFNATVAHGLFRSFVESNDLYDSSGSHPTWPQHGYPIPLHGFDGPQLALPLPPLLGLDHVLLRGMDVTDVQIGEGDGSDHKPVITSFVFQQSRD